jgi:hypothetical protein
LNPQFFVHESAPMRTCTLSGAPCFVLTMLCPNNVLF